MVYFVTFANVFLLTFPCVLAAESQIGFDVVKGV